MDNIYDACANVVLQVRDKKNSIRSAVYSSHVSNKRMLLRLACDVLHNYDVLARVAFESGLLKEAEFKKNPCLGEVILYDYLFGRTPGQVNCGKYRLKLLRRRAKQIEALKSELSAEEQNGGLATAASSKTITLPRYARVNTTMTSRDDFAANLDSLGWTLLSTEATNRKAFRKAVSSLADGTCMLDPDFDDLIVFPTGARLHDSLPCTSGQLILQDKSSCLATRCLCPPPNSVVLDACAAPGMKSAHLAALMGNTGKVYAIDRDKTRHGIMLDMLAKFGASIVEPLWEDFLRLDLSLKKFRKVKYALVDPPCSGSGIVKRLDYLTGENDTGLESGSANENGALSKRLDSLGNLQAMLLKHVLKLPRLKRVVYSTCSVHERENEAVIAEILTSTEKFKVVEPNFAKCGFGRNGWKQRGLSHYEFGHMCLRASPEKDLTNGFFVCVLETC